MTYAVRDCLVMLRRSLLHARRYPSLTLSAVLLPVVFLLLFVYVFGGTLGAGLGGGSGGRGARRRRTSGSVRPRGPWKGLGRDLAGRARRRMDPYSCRAVPERRRHP